MRNETTVFLFKAIGEYNYVVIDFEHRKNEVRITGKNVRIFVM